MAIIQVLIGVFATAGLFAWFGAWYGRKAGAGAGCGSCSGECGGSSCSLLDMEEPA